MILKTHRGSGFFVEIMVRILRLLLGIAIVLVDRDDQILGTSENPFYIGGTING